MYNFFNDDVYITNSCGCYYDTNKGFSSNFSINGNVGGWEIYKNIVMYGCWNGAIFGTSTDRYCSVELIDGFIPIDADKFFIIDISMLVEPCDYNRSVIGLTKFKIEWKRVTDSVWNEDRSIIVDIKSVGKWERYFVNLATNYYWQGKINNIRVYPFIDGREKDKFFIRNISVLSDNEYVCSNTECDYYINYKHNCKGNGSSGYIESAYVNKDYIYVNEDDHLLISIDDYGFESINVGINKNIKISDLLSILNDKLNEIDVGCFYYSDIKYVDNKIVIISGTIGNNSKVELLYTKLSYYLCFFNDKKEPIYNSSNGTDCASGFDYKPSKLLNNLTIKKLLSSSSNNGFRYINTPLKYSVEAGRGDFNEIGSGQIVSEGVVVYKPYNGYNKTVIDITHSVSSNGRIKTIWICGECRDGSYVGVFRRDNSNNYILIHKEYIDTNNSEFLYSKYVSTVKISTNFFVNKGDYIGVFNVDIYINQTISGLPDATYVEVNGPLDFISNPKVYSYGLSGFVLYAISDRRCDTISLDFDFGKRVNINYFNIYVQEDDNYFEYNVASCIDLKFSVDLFGNKHWHKGVVGGRGFYVEHDNIAYGIDCLNDCIKTLDGGKQGDFYDNIGNGFSSNGLETFGDHSYFYVNGDAEWLYSENCDSIAEFCWPYVPRRTGGFSYDPIAIDLSFPYDINLYIHKFNIVFKERNNFKNFYFAYLHGTDYVNGNVLKDRRFSYVDPNSIEYIKLDGTVYTYGDNKNVDSYLFKNPVFKNDSEESFDDQFMYVSSYLVDWVTLEYVFKPVLCNGFRIYSDYHNSTKILEIELFSTMLHKSSMVDNVLLKYSSNGEKWYYGEFVSNYDGISSVINGYPRFFSLEIYSIHKFELDFFSATTILEDNLLENNYSDRQGVINIINKYTTKCDLYIDIPYRNNYTNNSVVYKNIFNNDDSINNPEIGPKAFLNKDVGSDFINTGLCSTNSDFYALNNLSNDSHIFISYNNGISWNNLGEYNDGLFITNIETLGYKLLDISFIDIKCDKIKIFCESGNVVLVDGIYVLNDNSIVDTSFIQYNDSVINYNNSLLKFDNNIFEFNFIDKNYCEYDTHYNNINVEYNGFGYISYYVYNDIYLSSFIVEFDYIINNENIDVNSEFIISLYSNTDIIDIKFTYIHEVYNSSTLCSVYCNGSFITSKYINFLYTHTNKFKLCFINGKLLLFINGINEIYNVNIGYTNINKIKFYHNFISGLSNLFSINNIYIYNNVIINNSGNFIIKLDKSEVINKICLLVSNEIDSLMISVSNNNNMYFILDNIEYNYDYLYTNVLFKLNSVYYLDYIRNYQCNVRNNYNSVLLYVSKNDLVEFFLVDNYFNIEESTYEYANSVCFYIPSSTFTIYTLNKIGIYPDITVTTVDNNNNCYWTYIGTFLFEYDLVLNISLYSDVTQTTSYFDNCIPSNAINGNINDCKLNECWCFKQGLETKFYLKFIRTYYIDSIDIYLGNNSINTCSINSLELYVYDSNNNIVFIDNFYNLNNIKNTLKFDLTEANGIIIYFKDVNYVDINIFNATTGINELHRIFIVREIDVYNVNNKNILDSNEYPIICFNLHNRFYINDINIQTTDNKVILQDNLYNISYSVDNFNKPSLLNFYNSNKAELFIYNGSENFLIGDKFLDERVFLPKGTIYIHCDIFNNNFVDCLSLSIQGKEKYDVYFINYSDGWEQNTVELYINEDGYYSLAINRNNNINEYWAIKNLIIYAYLNEAKWVSVCFDYADCYYSQYSDGKNILISKVLVYSGTHILTDYVEWWKSEGAVLENDYLLCKYRKPYIRISTFNNICTTYLLLLDNIVVNYNWSVYDYLSIVLFIDNYNDINLDNSYIQLGNSNVGDTIYYRWYLSSFYIINGFNKLNLFFYKADKVSPIEQYNLYFNSKLNLNENKFNNFIIYLETYDETFICFGDIKFNRTQFEIDDSLYLYGNELLELPLSNVSLNKGLIKSKIKLCTSHNGVDLFKNMNDINILSISDNNNNIISIGIKAASWFVLTINNLRNFIKITKDVNSLDTLFGIGDILNLKIIWDFINGINNSSNTIEFYIDNKLALYSSYKLDITYSNDFFIKLGGGLSQNISDFNIISNMFYYDIEISSTYINDYNGDTHYPSDFIEISKDGNNFYGYGSDKLPLVYDDVYPKDTVNIYYKVTSSGILDTIDKTAIITTEWVVPI